MDASSGNAESSPETGRPSQPRLRGVESQTFNRPCLDFLADTDEARHAYLNLCVPLSKYASEGNWEKAKPMLLNYGMLRSAGIARGWTTVLHVAAGAGQVHFVKELVNLMNGSNLDWQDSIGNTALSFAAIAGNLEIVKLLCQRNNSLPKIRSGTGFTPLLFAALHGKADVADYLFPLTADDENFDEAQWNTLFLTCIESGIYDLALQVLEARPAVAFARNVDDMMTGLHIMAQKTDLGSGRPDHQNQLTSTGTKNSVAALKLVRLLWNGILGGGASISLVREIINEPSRLLFDATKVGNFDFLVVLMNAFPDLIWELDERCHSIIHAAVVHRQPKIFNLIHAYSGSKDIILAFKDDNGNNILHLAAKLAPPDRLELVSGAAFQMKLELLWFQEVRKTVLPSYMNKKNENGETPRELFAKEHAALRKDAERWMEKTANSCMVVSALIATGVFSAAFSLPGGTNDDSGTPNYLWKRSFMIFAISDAIAMVSSSASILVFLSILISSCYSDEDFYKSLPSRLILGLISLFVSITSMMIAFGCAFFVTYDHGHDLKWVPTFISVLSFFPIAIFLSSQFQLLHGIIYSTYYFSIQAKQASNLLGKIEGI